MHGHCCGRKLGGLGTESRRVRRPACRAGRARHTAVRAVPRLYPLLPQDPGCENLVTWFESFAAVHGAPEGAAAGGAQPKKRAAVKTAKRKGGAAGGSEAAAAEKRLRRELAARFSQATAELQYVGLIKPARRRRGDYVQRTVHQPAAGL